MTNDDRSARDVLADAPEGEVDDEWERDDRDWTDHVEVALDPVGAAAELARSYAECRVLRRALEASTVVPAGFHVVKDEPCETCGDSGEVVVESPWPTADVLRPCPACSGEGR